MNKVIIPRKDHEVYFLPLPDELKTRQIPVFAAEQMEKLHPAFSSSSLLDLQQLIFGKKRWIMATVMNAGTLTEYKILEKGKTFYTNTSIAVRRKDFLQNGINTIDDERIGFDAEKNEPVSIPDEPAKGLDCPGSLPDLINRQIPELETELKTIPSRFSVFGKKLPKGRIAAVTVITALMVFLTSAFSITKQEKKAMPEPKTNTLLPVTPTEPERETKYLPFSIEILAEISSYIVKAGGKMTQWQYNGDIQPLVTIQLQGINALAAYEICDLLEYVYLEDIRDIRYINGEPHITLHISAGTSYSTFTAGMFSGQNSTLSMIAELTGTLRQQGVSIVSEGLPGAGNGNLFYTITYTAKDRNLIQSLETIADTCSRYSLWVNNMDISISSDDTRFSVACTLSHNYETSPAITLPGEKDKIPAAFGYREPRVPVAAPVIKEIPKNEIEPPVIGSIKDGGGNTVFYRDTDNGKIQVRVEQ